MTLRDYLRCRRTWKQCGAVAQPKQKHSSKRRRQSTKSK